MRFQTPIRDWYWSVSGVGMDWGPGNAYVNLHAFVSSLLSQSTQGFAANAINCFSITRPSASCMWYLVAIKRRNEEEMTLPCATSKFVRNPSLSYLMWAPWCTSPGIVGFITRFMAREFGAVLIISTERGHSKIHGIEIKVLHCDVRCVSFCMNVTNVVIQTGFYSTLNVFEKLKSHKDVSISDE